MWDSGGRTLSMAIPQLRTMIFAITIVVTLAQDPTPPAAGLSDYITYDPGDCNLIISVTHGGSQRPEDIPDRTVCEDSYKGCKLPDGTCVYSHDIEEGTDCQCSSSTCAVSYFSDTNTDDIALLMQARILQKTGKKPHLVKNELQRRKLDPNREINEATFGNQDSIHAYETFHYYIDLAKSTIPDSEYGMVLDIHGQTHSEQWTEFGYAIPKDYITDSEYTASVRDNYASICSLVTRECAGHRNEEKCFKKLIRKRKSLAGRFRGYPSVPSKQYPESDWTSADYNYYSGGYVTQTHGSRGCAETPSHVDAIQIEMPRDIRFNETLHARYVKKLSKAIIGLMDEFYTGWRED